MEIYVHRRVLEEEGLNELSAGLEGVVNFRTDITKAHVVIADFSDFETPLLEMRRKKSLHNPPIIVLCDEEQFPECHGQHDFADLNAIPVFQPDKENLRTVLSNLSKRPFLNAFACTRTGEVIVWTDPVHTWGDIQALDAIGRARIVDYCPIPHGMYASAELVIPHQSRHTLVEVPMSTLSSKSDMETEALATAGIIFQRTR